MGVAPGPLSSRIVRQIEQMWHTGRVDERGSSGIAGLTLNDVIAAYSTPVPLVVTDAATGKSHQELAGIWTGRASPQQLFDQATIGERLAREVWDTVRAHPLYVVWRRLGERELEWVRSRSSVLPPPRNKAALHGVKADQSVETELVHVLRDAIKLAFGIKEVLRSESGGFTSMEVHPVTARTFASQAPIWRDLSRAIVRTVGLEPDFWRSAAALAYLFSPEMAPDLLFLPYWMGSPETPRNPVTAQAGTALGVPDRTERVAYKAKVDWRRNWGSTAVRGTPGPRTGSHQTPTVQRLALEQYLLARSRTGVSAQILAEDAEANRLYRATRKDDPLASLDAQAVRRVLRQHRR
jgi:hypothetical protein